MLASRPSGPLPGRDHATPPGKVVNSTHSGDDALTAPPSAPALESECSAPSSSGRFSPPSSPAPWWPRAPPPAGRPARLTWPGPARSARKRWFSRLPPRDVSGLHALAGRGGRLSPQVREARRHQALGGLARAAQVADTVQSLGLQVVGSSETSVTASGSAQQLQALFGSARQSSPRLRTAQPLPRLPAVLQGLVTIAAGGDESRPARHPLNQSPTGTFRPPSCGKPTPSQARARPLLT